MAGGFFTTEPPGKYYQIYMLSYLCKWGWKVKVKVKSLSPVRLFVTPWTVVYQASPSMEFSRQEYWSGLPLWAWHKTQDIPVSNLVFPHGITMAFCIFLEWEGTIQEQSVSGLTADRLSLNCFDDVILLSLQLIFFFFFCRMRENRRGRVDFGSNEACLMRERTLIS